MVEARMERDKIIKDASSIASKIREEAKNDALKIAEKMIEDAKQTIILEKQAAVNEIRNQVAEFSIRISEKILRKKLSDKKSQKMLIAEYMKDLNLN
jgi:F-type H+-transporting ATPase subunit b